MATHSNIPAWRIPWTGEPGSLYSMGSHGIRHDLVTKQQHCQTKTTLDIQFLKRFVMTLLLLLLLSRFSRVRLCATPQTAANQALPRLWDSPGKNTGVGCHFLLQCMKVKSESEVAQSCLTLSDPMDCSLPGSSAHGIFQARVLEWVAIAFSV